MSFCFPIIIWYNWKKEKKNKLFRYLKFNLQLDVLSLSRQVVESFFIL